MEKIEKKTLLYSVQNHIANFISEEHQIKDAWIQTYEFNGVFFNVYAYGYVQNYLQIQHF